MLGTTQPMNHTPPTRKAVLVAYAQQHRTRTGQSHEDWSEEVDRQYCDRVAEGHRSLPAPDLQRVAGTAEWFKLRRAWNQALRRYEDGSLNMPVELEEAWVYALSEPYRSDCIRELAERYGLWGARRRPSTAAGDADAYGATMHHVGELIRTAGEMMADGRFGPEDEAALPGLQTQIERARSDLEALKRQAEQGVRGEAVRRVS